MSVTIEMPVGLNELDKVFDVIDFLENKQELLEKFSPEVSKLLIKEQFFTGIFKRKYDEMFDELITSLIRKELTNHFTSYTPEELLLLTDLQFMKLVDDDVLYNKKNYITEDKKQ